MGRPPCRWCGGKCDGKFVKKLLDGEVSNRKNGPIPTAVWELFASADMEDVEDALLAHGLTKNTRKWSAAKKNLRRVRNQYRARLCQARVRTQLEQKTADNNILCGKLEYQQGRADRFEAILQAQPAAMPPASRLKGILVPPASACLPCPGGPAEPPRSDV